MGSTMTLDSKFKGRRVLIMDDSRMAIKSLSKLLRNLEFEIDTSEDGAEAVECYTAAYLRGHPYELVIFDLQVPGGMGGEQALQKIMEIDPEVKAIVQSGDRFNPIVVNFRQHGFRAAIAKPYGLMALKVALEKTLQE